MSTQKSTPKPQKKTKEMEYEEKLKLLDAELMSFYQYCKQAGFTPAEMDIICAPLVASLRKHFLKKVAKVVSSIVIVAAVLYGFLQIDVVNNHASALGRLLLIKLLPVWDWTYLFYESCLVTNPFYGDYSLTEEDCISCETLDAIDRVGGVSYEQLLDNYLSRDAPLIVVDAMDSWPVMNTDDFWFDNITQLYLQDEKLADTVPCILTTNLRPGSSDLHVVLQRIHSLKVEKWFVHWQNCDIHAVKALRKFYQRPYFLASSVSPAHFNWVLMSSDYNTKVYKKVELDSGLIMLAQLRGSTAFRLTPMNPCNSSCPMLLGDLQEGEMLVFTNFLWAFEYFPGRNLDNVAILTETVWDETSK
ncbi:uncharacterized protein LOC126100432 [Schistocerca cancellata]|uniref:uncharacterized protein LOC126100432 n=1 Tax=Schistocerca cancellata TaxID=274614 RepID=UPI002117C581|nr:uncharacterized protein LOC126100432 [Schistocerca cancellata]